MWPSLSVWKWTNWKQYSPGKIIKKWILLFGGIRPKREQSAFCEAFSPESLLEFELYPRPALELNPSKKRLLFSFTLPTVCVEGRGWKSQEVLKYYWSAKLGCILPRIWINFITTNKKLLVLLRHGQHQRMGEKQKDKQTGWGYVSTVAKWSEKGFYICTAKQQAFLSFSLEIC